MLKFEIVQKLAKAIEFLEQPGRWCKGVLARRANGLSTSPYDENATQWCAIGAMYKCGMDAREVQAVAAAMPQRLTAGGRALTGTERIFNVNDSNGKDAILSDLRDTVHANLSKDGAVG